MKLSPDVSSRGFTLVEVLLAVGIALGLMLVVLFFYSQAARLRADVLEQTERAAVIRRVMDRLTTELRTSVPHEYLPSGLVGDSNYIMFARAVVPGGEWDAEIPRSDLRVISYGLTGGGETNGLGGLTRTEEPLLRALWEYVLEEVEGVEEVEEESVADQWGDPGAALLTDQVRYLRFRYWNGWWWQDTWERLDLPVGVEISLGGEPLPPEAEEYPFELFRRVIYLPGNEAPDAWGVFDLFGGVGSGREEDSSSPWVAATVGPHSGGRSL